MNEFRIEYVLGFAFDLGGNVALIRKTHPDWQAGRWNGVGGARNGMETPVEAMVREFEEETGVKTHAVQWRKAGVMLGAPGTWVCQVFTMHEALINRVKTTTDEIVQLFNRKTLLEIPTIENVPALVELCLVRKDHTDCIPEFTLDYSKHP